MTKRPRGVLAQTQDRPYVSLEASLSNHQLTVGESAQAATRLSRNSVCPGTGVRLVPRTYKVRPVTDADREQYARFERHATERGDADEAEYYRSVIPKWESEVGQEREALVCAVCGRMSLSPTRAGTARRHQRWDTEAPSWDRVYQLLVVDELSSALEVETERAEWPRLLGSRTTTIVAVSHRRPGPRAILREGDRAEQDADLQLVVLAPPRA